MSTLPMQHDQTISLLLHLDRELVTLYSFIGCASFASLVDVANWVRCEFTSSSMVQVKHVLETVVQISAMKCLSDQLDK